MTWREYALCRPGALLGAVLTPFGVLGCLLALGYDVRVLFDGPILWLVASLSALGVGLAQRFSCPLIHCLGSQLSSQRNVPNQYVLVCAE
jgi:hypothetical protein